MINQHLFGYTFKISKNLTLKHGFLVPKGQDGKDLKKELDYIRLLGLVLLTILLIKG